MRRRFKRGVIDHLERRLIEVTLVVRVRIEEETLGATFHDDQNLKGFFRIRPVFLRIEPTFESSFLGSFEGLVMVVAGFTDAFWTGAFAGSLVGAGFGASAGGTWLASAGCASGVGLTSGTGFDVVAVLCTGVSTTGGVVFRCVET